MARTRRLLRFSPLIAGLVLAACRYHQATVSVPGFFRYSREEVMAALKGGGVAWGVIDLDRDSQGSRLYVYSYWADVAVHGGDRAVILSANAKVTRVSEKLPGVTGDKPYRAYLNDEGHWGAWLTPGEANFNGWTRAVFQQWLWVDHGAGHYVIALDERGSLELGTTDGRVRQSVAAFEPRTMDALPRALFSHEGTIYLFRVRRGAIECEVFEESRGGFELKKTVRIPERAYSTAAIVDMDPVGERVVAELGGDWDHYWVLYDFKTATVTDIGRPSRFGLFMKQDLVRAKTVPLE
jgi:hypothetical protein